MNSDPSQQTSEAATTACGGTLKNTDGWPRAIYQGKQIYFCSASCLQVFEQYPDDFMLGKIEHPTE
jgi:YHS domain-containing protein